MSPTLPSWMAGRAAQPFVIGPLNGNLDWPAAFAAEQKREREQLRKLRDFYKLLPYARRTWRKTSAVLAAFQHTIDDLDAVPAARVVSFPEVGYDESIFFPPERLTSPSHTPAPSSDPTNLTFLFAGRLVPYKLAEVAVRAFIGSEAQAAGHSLRVVGDGPERQRLEEMVAHADANGSVTFDGRLDQTGVADAMRASDVFIFPSIRELGAGVVVEAMACGLLCVVVDYGGPADLIAPGRGRKLAMAPLEDLIDGFRNEIDRCAADAGSEAQLATRANALRYVRENYRWTQKAAHTVEIYTSLLAGRDPSSR